MRDDAFDTNDKTNMSHIGALLWLRDNPEHEGILREVLQSMSPGQRSRLNTPIAARQTSRGLGALGLLGWRRKRRAQAVA